ncbi:putative UDP-Gal or UDP-GlcNAc-dependent glycosyltransferase, partial [Trypanosoma grayi]|uniref:putative UDP-Gal or UDP-GlcNAc-dependent glycosyltransferase n=1 Tax=Trypanosoma grayi TaxID=71804 RepID=UPI0004F3F613
DVAASLVSYKPLQRLARLPYTRKRAAEFLSLDMHHEDVMVGRVLYEVKSPHLLIVGERVCRFHNLRSGPFAPVSNSSVVIHHLLEHEYKALMRRFSEDTNPRATSYNRTGGLMIFSC